MYRVIVEAACTREERYPTSPSANRRAEVSGTAGVEEEDEEEESAWLAVADDATAAAEEGGEAGAASADK
jgi:hypothetical protein